MLKGTKARKGKKKRSKKLPRKFPPARTVNGKRIQQALAFSNRRPDQYKDWVIIMGSRLIDWAGSYDILIKQEDGRVEVDNTDFFLVHKRDLKSLIGERASDFWHEKLNRRVQRRGPRA